MAVQRTRKTQPVPTGTASSVKLRRFVLERHEDVSGTSGLGTVAEGTMFSNGQAVVHFISQMESINVYANMTVVEALHGHDGRTSVRWLDE